MGPENQHGFLNGYATISIVPLLESMLNAIRLVNCTLFQCKHQRAQLVMDTHLQLILSTAVFSYGGITGRIRKRGGSSLI